MELSNLDKTILRIFSFLEENTALRNLQIVSILYHIETFKKTEFNLVFIRKPSKIDCDLIDQSIKKLVDLKYLEPVFDVTNMIKTSDYTLSVKGALFLNKHNFTDFDSLIMAFVPTVIFSSDREIFQAIIKKAQVSALSIEFNQPLPVNRLGF